MIENLPTKISDGDDEIIFSEAFNLYSNSLKIEGLLKDLNVTFNFEEDGSEKRKKDIDISGDFNNAVISFSSKIRNALGSGTTGKIELAEINKDGIKQKLLFSLYSSSIGDKSSGLNVSITFYLRKV
jgi:hypothetical protein